MRNQMNLFNVKLNGIKCGKGVYVGKNVSWVSPLNIRLGNNVSIAQGVRFWSEVDHGRLEIEDDVLIARNCVIDFSGDLTLEKGVLISEGSIIYTHDHGKDPRSVPTACPLIIEEGAWIATGVIVLPSVKRIGRGAIVGAGVVLSKDLEDGEVCVSSANRVLKGQ